VQSVLAPTPSWGASPSRYVRSGVNTWRAHCTHVGGSAYRANCRAWIKYYVQSELSALGGGRCCRIPLVVVARKRPAEPGRQSTGKEDNDVFWRFRRRVPQSPGAGGKEVVRGQSIVLVECGGERATGLGTTGDSRTAFAVLSLERMVFVARRRCGRKRAEEEEEWLTRSCPRAGSQVEGWVPTWWAGSRPHR